MRGLSSDDLDNAEARARRVLDGWDTMTRPQESAALLAGELLATVTELRWWREHYGADPVPYAVVVNQ